MSLSLDDGTWLHLKALSVLGSMGQNPRVIGYIRTALCPAATQDGVPQPLPDEAWTPSCGVPQGNTMKIERDMNGPLPLYDFNMKYKSYLLS